MKLINKSLIYLSAALLLIVGVWATVFYVNLIEEIKESVDEGLDNYKRQIVYKVSKDPSLLHKENFDESFFAIHKISKSQALQIHDHYRDVKLYMQDDDDEKPELEPVRMLSTAFALNGSYYKLEIINSMVEENDLIEEFFQQAVWLYTVLLISIIGINSIVLRRLWKPFYSFLDQLKNFRLGRHDSLPTITTNTKEFTDLHEAVSVLLTHTIATFDQQKQFIGNASHELQTPLAIITNKLELLIENDDLKAVQAEEMAKIMSIVQRLVRLNKSLLLLSKIENKQFLDNKTVVLNTVIAENVEDLEAIAEFKAVDIQVDNQQELMTEMDPAMANVLVSNLLRNALFYNISGGKITVELTTDSIRIKNTGDQLALDADRIFTRFYKSDTNQASSGLGLAIVKAICELYQFKITYQFEAGLHEFAVTVN